MNIVIKLVQAWNDMRKLCRTCAPRQLLLILLVIFQTFPKAFSQEYFQQEVNYKIHVTLNDQDHELRAFETVEYINNSPDTLGFLYYHLWPNAYSCNNTALARQIFSEKGKEKMFKDPVLNGTIDSLDFRVDGQRVQWNLIPGFPDICQITVDKPINPGDTIHVSTPFRVKIPEGVTSRLGHIGESYQISQWYPKPAVYDRSGWHQMPYLDQGEFYSEFGSFDVSITLPSNYIVGATGNLQNDRELEMLEELAADTAWKKNIDKRATHFPPSSEQMKTLRYTEDQIHDFAWFADKRFHVLKGKVKLSDQGKEVTTWVMFTNQQAGLWSDALQYVNNAIKNFSHWIGDYPYNNFTAVQSALSAGAGMEYPGLTVIGLVDDAYSLDEVITHETAHSWFYSALGSNERRYPYMDEGIASAYHIRYMNERYPGKKLWEVYIKNRKIAKFLHLENMPVGWMEELQWLTQARVNLEKPINLASPDYTYSEYYIFVYYKAAVGFNYLRAYLGDSLFDSTMHQYYQQWKFRHPQPDDLREVFESCTNKDLSWFFDDYLGTCKRLDYKAVRLEKQQLLVKNNGQLVSPLVISGTKGDSICFEKWVDGFEGQKWLEIPQGNYSEIKIDPGHVMPELFRLNNNMRTSGIFPRADSIRTQLFSTIEDPEKRTFFYMPAINWKKEDGFMIGAALYNGFLVPKPLEYFLLPFYSFENNGLAGLGRISFNITPHENFIRMATITLLGTQFRAPGNQNYRMAKAGLDLYFRTSKMNNPLRQKVYGYYIAASDLTQIELMENAGMCSFLQFGYQLEKTGIINPFKLLFSYEYNESFQKTSVELNYKLSYYGKNRGLDIRFFTGTMLKNTSKSSFHSLSANGRSGRELYLYQGTYPDRFGVFPETFFSRQMTLSEGGLVSPISESLGYSPWLVSLTLSSSLPGKAGWVPIKPFINLLVNDQGPFYEAGLKAGVWNFFEIYFPLLVSQNIQSINGSLKDRIRFVLILDLFNPQKLNSRIAI